MGDEAEAETAGGAGDEVGCHVSRYFMKSMTERYVEQETMYDEGFEIWLAGSTLYLHGMDKMKHRRGAEETRKRQQRLLKAVLLAMVSFLNRAAWTGLPFSGDNEARGTWLRGNRLTGDISTDIFCVNADR